MAHTPFEQLVEEYVQSFNPNVTNDFCQIERVTILNSIIENDLVNNPAMYNSHLKYMSAYMDMSSRDYPPAVENLLIGFQKTWFQAEMNLLINRDYDRSQKLSKETGVGVLSLATAIIVIPSMRKYATRPFRVIRSLVRFMLQRRPFLVSSSAIVQVKGRPRKKTKKSAAVFLPPPLLHPSISPDPQDLMADDVYARDFINNMASVTGGVVLGSIAGNTIDHAYELPTWSKLIPESKWTGLEIPRLFSPQMLLRLAVTIAATDATSSFIDFVESRSNYVHYYELLRADVDSLKRADHRKNDYQIWLRAKQLENDSELARFIMIKSYLSDRDKINAAALESFCRNGMPGDASATGFTLRHQYEQKFAQTVNDHRGELAEAHALTKFAEGQMMKLESPVIKPFVQNANAYFVLEAKVLHAPAKAALSYWQQTEFDGPDLCAATGKGGGA